jgi:hypothetical protein
VGYHLVILNSNNLAAVCNDKFLLVGKGPAYISTGKRKNISHIDFDKIPTAIAYKTLLGYQGAKSGRGMYYSVVERCPSDALPMGQVDGYTPEPRAG